MKKNNYRVRLRLYDNKIADLAQSLKGIHFSLLVETALKQFLTGKEGQQLANTMLVQMGLPEEFSRAESPAKLEETWRDKTQATKDELSQKEENNNFLEDIMGDFK